MQQHNNLEFYNQIDELVSKIKVGLEAQEVEINLLDKEKCLYQIDIISSYCKSSSQISSVQIYLKNLHKEGVVNKIYKSIYNRVKDSKQKIKNIEAGVQPVEYTESIVKRIEKLGSKVLRADFKTVKAFKSIYSTPLFINWQVAICQRDITDFNFKYLESKEIRDILFIPINEFFTQILFELIFETTEEELNAEFSNEWTDINLELGDFNY